MTGFIERLQEEYGELSARMLKLESFMKTEMQEVSQVQRSLLDAQLNAMRTYSSLLCLRLVDLAKHSHGEDV